MVTNPHFASLPRAVFREHLARTELVAKQVVSFAADCSVSMPPVSTDHFHPRWTLWWKEIERLLRRRGRADGAACSRQLAKEKGRFFSTESAEPSVAVAGVEELGEKSGFLYGEGHFDSSMEYHES